MPGNYKKQPRTFNPKPPQAREPQPQTEELEEEAKWNPTPEVFEGFLVRDRQLATNNVRMVLSSSGPANLKYLKDSTLHSSDCIEQVLAEGMANGSIVENKGRYSLAPRTVR